MSKKVDSHSTSKRPKKLKFITYVGLLSVFVLAAAYFVTKINVYHLFLGVKLPLLPVEDPNLYWGSYDPHYYISMSHINASALHFGVLWFAPFITMTREKPFLIRSTCTEGVAIKSYNWLYHDGEKFGVQQLVDNDYVLRSSFIKPSPESWTLRIDAANRLDSPTELTVIGFLVAPHKAQFQFDEEANGLTGRTNSLDLFEFKVHAHPKALLKHLKTSLLETVVPLDSVPYILDLDQASFKAILGSQTAENGYRNMVLDANNPPNIIFYEIRIELPKAPLDQPLKFAGSEKILTSEYSTVVEFEFKPVSSKSAPLFGENYTKSLQMYQEQFSKHVTRIFQFKSFTTDQINFARLALSNLLGGIGYFHGESLVKLHSSGNTVYPSGPHGLLTATPSRNKFPRGFLWDEGFHQLIIARWNPRLAMNCLSHWLNLMHPETGWIPREQILGREARTLVPEEFVVQSDLIANPPTLFLSMEYLFNQAKDSSNKKEILDWLHAALPRLHSWYQWYNRTQQGIILGTYYWYGRTIKPEQLNPLTLSSGLDDAPRASHPNSDERHVDLYCWMARFSQFLADLTSTLKKHQPDDLVSLTELHSKYSIWARFLGDEERLEKFHWSADFQRFADYGLHTDSIALREKQMPDGSMQLQRFEMAEPRRNFIESTHGIISYFPLALRVLSPKSEKLPLILEDLIQETGIWSAHGLRSLAQHSPFYQKANSEHDPPYWRGAIWINVNYLVLDGLKFYARHADTPKPTAERALQIARQLQANLVKTVLGEYERTGFLWEQYSDETGTGQRASPFSGWSTLITLIMQDLDQ